MRQIRMSGYIDDAQYCGDEITPDIMESALRGENGDLTDDVHITLSSYGGSIDAAAQIYDVIADYPGSVSITASGTLASAAVGMAMAADRLDMTPGSMMMIHDPMTCAFGNEADLTEVIGMLRKYKESILNLYEKRITITREEAFAMMTDATWMDANEALKYGFIDAIHEPESGALNAAKPRAFDRDEAERKISAYYTRKSSMYNQGGKHDKPHSGGSKPHGMVNARLKRLNLIILDR